MFTSASTLLHNICIGMGDNDFAQNDMGVINIANAVQHFQVAQQQARAKQCRDSIVEAHSAWSKPRGKYAFTVLSWQGKVETCYRETHFNL